MSQTLIQPKRQTVLLPGSLQNLFFPPQEGEYGYFKRAAECPYSKCGDIVKAAWAADAAMLSYARCGSTRMTGGELEQNLAAGGLTLRAKIGQDPNDWNAPGTQAFFATGNDFAILAFRGTEVDDPADSLADLDILLFPEPDYHGSASPSWGHLSTVEHLFSAPCLVHHGFQSALNKVWAQVYQQVTAYRQQNPAAEICLTGHSLGGALALLTYARFSDPNMAAYTFGCPRSGNTGFRLRVAANPGRGHFRFVNFDDIVTHIPLESFLYQHAPEACYHFQQDGTLDMDTDGTALSDLSVVAQTADGLPADFRTDLQQLDQAAPPGAVDHSPARYAMRLWDCV